MRLNALVLLLLAWVLLDGPSAQAAGASLTPAARFELLVADAKATMLADPHQAVSKASTAEAFALRQAPSRQREVMKATAQWLRGEAFMRLNDLDAARPLIASALRIAAAQAPGSNLHADILLSSGGIDTISADVGDALVAFQRAHAMYLKLGEVRSQAKALQSIGALYGGANDYGNALRYYDQALAVYKGDPGLLLSIYNNRGNALDELGRHREAERQFYRALALADQMQSRLLRVVVLSNIAEARLASGNVSGAQTAIDRGLQLSTRGEAAGFRKKLYAIDAQAAFQRHDFARASTLIAQRFADADLAKSTLLDREAHRTAYTIYRATGRDDLALRHLAVLKRLDDEATNLARSANAALMAARFDFANQELKIANLQRDEARRSVAFEQARARSQRNLFLGAAAATAIIIVMLGVGLVTIRRSRNEVRAANDDLAVTNQALGKALAAKTEFLATTSHEIRTPLNGILGMTQVMLADAAMPAATRDRLTVVHDAGVTMRALVDDILDVAKMENGHLTIEQEPFDLKAMLSDSTRLWEDQAAAKGLVFQRDIDRCPGRIVGDGARLRQIVFNLMSNALKFTASGSVTLGVDVTRENRLRIVISDTGVGIAPEKCEEIFESFRQADTSTTRQFGGTGLGLAICRNLARAMGGDVTATSRPGEGSRFTVDLPLVPAAAEADPVAATAPSTPPLLILDRNPITRSMLKTLMTPHAGAVAQSATLGDALARLGEGPADRVLADGAALLVEEDVADAARRLVAAAGDAPVTLLWPANAEAERIAVEAIAGVRIVAKPVSGTALIARVYPQRDRTLVSQAA